VWFNEHQHSLISNKYTNFRFFCKVTLRQYIMFCWHFLTTWFVRNFRNTASYPRGKEAAHTQLWEYKNLQNSPHLTVCTRPLRFKLQWISPSLGSWWCESWSVDGLHWLRYCRLSAVLENVETVIAIRPWRSDWFYSSIPLVTYQPSSGHCSIWTVGSFYSTVIVSQ